MRFHLDHDTLAAYLDGRLAVAELDRADAHIDECGSCRSELSTLAAIHTQPPARGDVDAAQLLGRYVVLRELGRGAMGVVLRAYDPELARPVALKLLRDGDGLRREAQAMARLRHPNVVTVYDVVTEARPRASAVGEGKGTEKRTSPGASRGDAGDAHFVAMELVDGDTLRGYCRGRPPREVLAACIRAGRGLAAAHDAGIIHRDFKPENVLCSGGDDVRVSDFGLARSVDDATPQPASGTPAYMAPELYRHEPATPASDQWSFCVATYELLYGARPFDAANLVQLKHAVLTGEPAVPARPGREWRVLRRGLARDPAARWRSMHALLAALADDPQPRLRRRVALGMAVVVALAAGGGIARFATRGDAAACRIDASALGDAWNLARIAHVATALGGDRGRRVVAALDGHARTWLERRAAACAEDPCLERGRREFGELVRVIDKARDPLDAALRLRDPVACGTAADELPRDPVGRAVVEHGRDELDRASALLGAGKTGDAGALAARVLGELGARDAPAVTAEALLVRARAAIERGELAAADALLFDALHAAERARDDRLVAAAWVEIVLATGSQQHRFELALPYARAADAALARIGPRSDLQLRYDYALGALLLAHGQLAAARARLTAALALAIDEPRRRAQTGLVRAALCDVERQSGNLAAARTHCASAVALLEATYGPEHAKLAVTLNIVGGVAFAGRDLPAAARAFGRAAQIFERQQLLDQVAYPLALSNLGAVALARDDAVAARPHFERALAVFATHHPDHPQRVIPLQGLASIALGRDDAAQAIAYYGEARAAIAATYAPASPALSVVELNLALAYRVANQPARAQALLDGVVARDQPRLAARALEQAALLADDRHADAAALALRERALAAGTDDRAWTLLGIGDNCRRLGHRARAIAALEEALAAYEAQPDDPYPLGLARYRLARVLWDADRDRRRALALARAAREAFERAHSGTHLPALRAEVASWLRARQKT